jgi:hypothetical protein
VEAKKRKEKKSVVAVWQRACVSQNRQNGKWAKFRESSVFLGLLKRKPNVAFGRSIGTSHFFFVSFPAFWEPLPISFFAVRVFVCCRVVPASLFFFFLESTKNLWIVGGFPGLVVGLSPLRVSVKKSLSRVFSHKFSRLFQHVESSVSASLFPPFAPVTNSVLRIHRMSSLLKLGSLLFGSKDKKNEAKKDSDKKKNKKPNSKDQLVANLDRTVHSNSNPVITPGVSKAKSEEFPTSKKKPSTDALPVGASPAKKPVAPSQTDEKKKEPLPEINNEENEKLFSLFLQKLQTCILCNSSHDPENIFYNVFFLCFFFFFPLLYFLFMFAMELTQARTGEL